MRVLVTGGAGFIGLATAQALRARGDDVRIMDALTQPVHEPGAAGPGGFDFVQGDVRSKPDWIRGLDGIDAVCHLAAYQDYLKDFSTFFHVNAAGTAMLYEVIVERSLPVRRVVVASSQAVYGEGVYRCDLDGIVACEPRPAERLRRGEFEQRCPKCGGPVEPVPTPEDHADPRTPYGISKLAQERIALALGTTYEIPTAAMRYSIVHGAGQSPRNAYSGLLRSAALNLLAGVPPVAFEDGEQQRDYVAIGDAVSANLIALDHPDAPGRAYNVGGDMAWTVLEVIEALREISGRDIDSLTPGLYRVGDTRHIVSDVSRLRSLGWDARADLKAVWRDYWRWIEGLGIDPAIAWRDHQDMIERDVIRKVGA